MFRLTTGLNTEHLISIRIIQLAGSADGGWRLEFFNLRIYAHQYSLYSGPSPRRKQLQALKECIETLESKLNTIALPKIGTLVLIKPLSTRC